MLLRLVSYLGCIAILIASLNRLERSRDGWSQRSLLLSLPFEAIFLAWAAFDLLGGVDPTAVLLGALTPLCLQGIAMCALFSPAIRSRVGKFTVWAHFLFVLAAGFLGLLLVEVPYNTNLTSMEWKYVLLNAAVLGGGVLASWFLFQRQSFGFVLPLLLCLGFGLADNVLMAFKETTILPSDIAALSTAFSVAGGYGVVFDSKALAGIDLFALVTLFALIFPGTKPRGRDVAINLLLSLAIFSFLVSWYQNNDIERSYGVEVNVWSCEGSYMTYGAALGFLQRMQEIRPDSPWGYERTRAATVQSSLADEWDESHPGYPDDADEYLQLAGLEEMPSVLIVMNESFSDLSMYPGIEGYEGIHVTDDLDVLSQGALYVSARGGGTCNTEFEVLTGSNLGMIGGGVYPYMFYDLSRTDALPKTYSAMGYSTTAIHPCDASNWRRDVVYGQLGFGAFLSEVDFPEDAELLRGKITDQETYEVALDVLSNPGPQFVFDVTYMGHGGYSTGDPSLSSYESLLVNGQPVDEMGEYLAVMDEAEKDLSWLLDELSRLEKPVILLFFGDHQPGFNEELSNAAYGGEDRGLEGVQQRFSTQYFVWSNFGLESLPGFAGSDGMSETPTSTCYLGALSMYACGLPLNERQKAALQLRESVPAMNLNGYMDNAGSWYWNGQSSAVSSAFDDFAFIQYRNLFDNDLS